MTHKKNTHHQNHHTTTLDVTNNMWLYDECTVVAVVAMATATATATTVNNSIHIAIITDECNIYAFSNC